MARDPFYDLVSKMGKGRRDKVANAAGKPVIPPSAVGNVAMTDPMMALGSRNNGPMRNPPRTSMNGINLNPDMGPLPPGFNIATAGTPVDMSQGWAHALGLASQAQNPAVGPGGRPDLMKPALPNGIAMSNPTPNMGPVGRPVGPMGKSDDMSGGWGGAPSNMGAVGPTRADSLSTAIGSPFDNAFGMYGSGAPPALPDPGIPGMPQRPNDTGYDLYGTVPNLPGTWSPPSVQQPARPQDAPAKPWSNIPVEVVSGLPTVPNRMDPTRQPQRGPLTGYAPVAPQSPAVTAANAMGGGMNTRDPSMGEFGEFGTDPFGFGGISGQMGDGTSAGVMGGGFANAGYGSPSYGVNPVTAGHDFAAAQQEGFSYGGYNPSDPSGAGAGGSSKVVCTAMNEAYGFGGFRQAIWLAYSAKHMRPEHERGYHAIFVPLLAYARGGVSLPRQAMWLSLAHIARHRTADIRAEMRGGKRDRLGRMYRAVLEPLCYVVGKVLG